MTDETPKRDPSELSTLDDFLEEEGALAETTGGAPPVECMAVI